MTDLSNHSVDELKALRDNITEELKLRNKQKRERNIALKTERMAQFTGNVNDGDTIRFLYNREEKVAVVDRANPKTVTVTFEDGKRHYIDYSNVVAIVERAPEVKDEDEDEAEESEEAAQ